MKTSKFTPSHLLYLLLAFIFLSCSHPSNEVDKYKYTDIVELLNACEGYAVVISKGQNNGYHKAFRHWIIIKDGDGNVYEYDGAEYNVENGDTLINKY
jgi:quercetin dioxygenase-like cupin family protein